MQKEIHVVPEIYIYTRILQIIWYYCTYCTV